MRIAMLPQERFSQAARASRDRLICEALRRAGDTVIPIELPECSLRLWQRGWCRGARVLGLRYRPERNPSLLKRCARALQQQLGRVEADVILSMSTLHTAYLATHLPVVNWIDGSFASSVDFYDWHTGLDPLSRWEGHRAELRSLQQSALTVFWSAWASQAAARYYSVSPSQLRVLPPGAMLLDTPTRAEALARSPKAGELTSVLIGGDWARKGADVAWEAVKALQALGTRASLVTIGMEPPQSLAGADGLRCVPRLSKDKAAEWCRFRAELMGADVLLLPSRADFSPNVIPEGYAFGLPAVASAVGGIPELIDHGQTGFLVSDGQNPAAYARYLARLATRPTELARMRGASRARYEQEYSLETVARRLSSLLAWAIDEQVEGR